VGTFPEASTIGALIFAYDSQTKCATLNYPDRTVAPKGKTARLRLCKPGTVTDAVWSAWKEALVSRERRARARRAFIAGDGERFHADHTPFRALPLVLAGGLRRPPRRDQETQEHPLPAGGERSYL